MPYVITGLCTRDGACVDVCPVACIHTTPDAPQFYVDPDICIECEQCKIVCPVEAIFLDTELPPQWQPSAEVNAAFFQENKPEVAQISMEQARQMVQAAERYARRMGLTITVAVVDGEAQLLLVSSMGPVDADAEDLAVSRAYTAVSFQLATDQVGAGSRPTSFREMPPPRGARLVTGAGGLPIPDGLVIIGAIGVAGGGGHEQDGLCCRAGVSALDTPVH
jgi:uncharacterized protein GlcG (DUF336 family)/NAD-dependent dihydropyrimidine dehydrogenase PreA subunit